MTARRAAKTDITLAEELSYRDELTAPHFTGKHLLEDNGFLITAETDDHDVFAVSMIFNVDGTEWGGRPSTMRQTNFMAIPKTQRGKGLADNDYIGVRSDPVHSMELSVINEDGRVIWTIDDLQIVADRRTGPFRANTPGWTSTSRWAASAMPRGSSVRSPTSTRTDAPASNCPAGWKATSPSTE